MNKRLLSRKYCNLEIMAAIYYIATMYFYFYFIFGSLVLLFLLNGIVSVGKWFWFNVSLSFLLFNFQINKEQTTNLSLTFISHIFFLLSHCGIVVLFFFLYAAAVLHDLIVCLFVFLFIHTHTHTYRTMITIQSETKSILTDGDWKKLWMEAGNTNANLKKDNSIDSSDSPIFDDTEVSDRHLFTHSIII